ncbi:hypothetical protein [uncultured Methanofollis sp.]|nr:hypothetical protein [uncultured Methanofollis sp.]
MKARSRPLLGVVAAAAARVRLAVRVGARVEAVPTTLPRVFS